MKETLKLSSVALAVTLLSTSSAYALERAAPVQMAQAGPDEKAGGGGEGGGAREPRGGDEGGGAERPARQREKSEDAGPPPERPARPQREKSEDAGPPPERPARPSRDKDEEPAPKKAPAPAAADDGPPQKKVRPPKEDTDEPAARTAPPVEKKSAPPVEKKAAPEPKEPPASIEEPKQQPKAAPKADREPEPKIEKAPEPKAEPKELTPAPKGAEPGVAPDGKPKPPEPKPGAEKAPAPDQKRPEAEAPKKGFEGSPRANDLPGRKDGPPPKDGKAAPEAAPPAAGPVAAPSEVKDLKELKQERKERTEDGGKRIVIEEPDKRAIVKEDGKTIIRHDETERFSRLDRGKTRREKKNGLDISISIRPGGVEIFTETDERGRSLRRYRRDRDGREVILFDNRDYYRRHNDDSFVDAIVDLPPPRMSIPREEYIVDYEEASDVEIYETLSAPPVEEIDRTYSMEEVRRSPMLRDRMRRIDLDAINFEFGAWEVTQDQYPALQRVANAMRRVIDRNPDEMFLVEGHTDAVGSDEDNLSLSDRRAESVAIILTEQFAVPPENLTTQGYGEQYLKVNTEQAERQNRRVAVRRITPLLSRTSGR